MMKKKHIYRSCTNIAHAVFAMGGKRVARHLIASKRGIAAIETALLLPLFVFFIFALIDVSWTMLRRYSVEQAGAQLAVRMRENPAANVNSLAGSLGYGLVNFNGTSACLCVTQHTTLAAAAAAAATTPTPLCPCTSNNTGPLPRDPVTRTIPDSFLGVSASASFTPLSFVGRQFFGNTIDYRFHTVLAFERMPRTCYTIESYSLEEPSGKSHVGCADGFFLTGVSTSKGTAGRPFKPMVVSPNGVGDTHFNCGVQAPYNPTIGTHMLRLAGLQFGNGIRRTGTVVNHCDGSSTTLEAPHVMNFQGRCTANRYQYTCCSYDRQTTLVFEKPTEKY
ncbi:MAG: TadE/TadG family type IV pilus assembly protein [Holosporales bacterium]